MECFIDELALAKGQDPLALRRRLLAQSPKPLAVLNAVAERVGWDKPAAKGVFRGLAQTMGFGSYVAACTVKNGRIEQTNFHDYPALKLAEMPLSRAE